MRAKKILPFVLLAIGALFLLSSCDAILDALYANNTINVTAYVLIGGRYLGAQSPDSTVTVTLGGASGATVSAEYSGNSYPYAMYVLPSVTKLPNGNYNISSYFYDAVTGRTHATNYFYDLNGNQYTSVSMPYGGSTTGSFDVYFQ
jgi:hypothetical protein